MKKEIVVVISGWVLIGDVVEEPDRLVIHDAGVIRVWGTTAGLGEIALHGPSTSTIIDPCGMAIVLNPVVVMRIPCKEGLC